MRLFDSHLHLTDASFDADLDDVLRRAREGGVAGLVTVASDPRDAERCLDLARARERTWSTAGLHPHEAQGYDAEALRRVEALAAEPEVVAIGETGLDFHYDNAPRREQLEAFEAQLELGGKTGVPVVVHSRDADEETSDLIRRFAGRTTGVLHCFTGGSGLLDTALDAGWWISFSGLVTFRKFQGRGIVRRVPPERLLIETDSPYLAPVPRRGRRNEPALIAYTCEAVAMMRGVRAEELAELTTRNAADFYDVEVGERGAGR